jgi:hypothetical protein
MTSKRLLLFVFLAVTASVAWLSSETFGFSYLDLGNVVKAARNTQDVLIVGNSVIKTPSHCDDDPRSIAQMLAADLNQPVLDLSRGGMQLDQELALIKTSTLGRAGRQIVLPLAINDQLLASKVPTTGHDAWLMHMTGSVPRGEPAPPATYKGVWYGNYADYAAKYFPLEKAAAQCPELNVLDTLFVEFMYWRNFAHQKDFSSDKQPWVKKFQSIQRSGNHLLVAIFPYNREMVRTYFGTAEADRIDAEVGQVVAYLRNEGIPTLDLSTKLASSDFTDLWCACGHLNQSGRRKVSQALADGIKADGAKHAAL